MSGGSIQGATVSGQTDSLVINGTSLNLVNTALSSVEVVTTNSSAGTYFYLGVTQSEQVTYAGHTTSTAYDTFVFGATNLNAGGGTASATATTDLITNFTWTGPGTGDKLAFSATAFAAFTDAGGTGLDIVVGTAGGGISLADGDIFIISSANVDLFSLSAISTAIGTFSGILNSVDTAVSSADAIFIITDQNTTRSGVYLWSNNAGGATGTGQGVNISELYMLGVVSTVIGTNAGASDILFI